MNETLNIPDKLKIGFQERGDTYTGKLSYVTYINKKDETAKEKSWERWRDKKLTPLDLDNIPTEGFVLNKKAGGYSTGWNHRQTYCRVYDPRDFEFEISIENLLYILQECTATKGKGLEGEFVYAWSGKDLILLPVSSPDYQSSRKLIDSTEKISMKSLKIGASYKSKKTAESVIYIGKMTWYYFGCKEDSSTSHKLKSKIFPTFVDITNKKIYGIKNMSDLYFMINENELSLSEVEDYKEKFLHTFHGQANLIERLTLEKNGSNYNYGDYFYFNDIDDNGVVYEIKVNKTHTFEGKTYNELAYINGRYGWRENNKNNPFDSEKDFLKVADLSHDFKIIRETYLNNDKTEYDSINYYNRGYRDENLPTYDISEEKKQSILKNKNSQYKIFVIMKNGDICEMETEYRDLSSPSCDFK